MVEGYQTEFVIADKAYDSDPFREWLLKHDVTPMIPPRTSGTTQHEYDERRYRLRHRVECFIGKLKHYRRAFSRFEKLAKNYAGFLAFLSAVIVIR